MYRLRCCLILAGPDPAKPDPALSLSLVADKISEMLGCEVPLVQLQNAQRPAPGQIQLLENTRFNQGEKANDSQLAKLYARCGDVFVMDAFASAHRAEASTVAIAHEVDECCAGVLMQAECLALEKALSAPTRPLLAIIGGAKVSTKLTVLENLSKLADQIVVGGGIANTFLAAQGHPVGKSLYEPELLPNCQKLLSSLPGKFLIPSDVVVATSIEASTGSVKSLAETAADEMILDVGPQTSLAIDKAIEQAKTIVWNGALGVFERRPFGNATNKLAKALGSSSAFTLAGGGETIAAIKQFQVSEQISYLSTGGGALLEFIEGKVLPGLRVLQ